MIGYNYCLLEHGVSDTTSHAFIIRNGKEINLYEAALVKNKYEYVFQKRKKLASGKDKE